jgi:hypothetical protein
MAPPISPAATPAATPLGVGGDRHCRTGQGRDGGKRHQRLPHDFTFPVEQITAEKFHIPLE